MALHATNFSLLCHTDLLHCKKNSVPTLHRLSGGCEHFKHVLSVHHKHRLSGVWPNTVGVFRSHPHSSESLSIVIDRRQQQPTGAYLPYQVCLPPVVTAHNLLKLNINDPCLDVQNYLMPDAKLKQCCSREDDS